MSHLAVQAATTPRMESATLPPMHQDVDNNDYGYVLEQYHNSVMEDFDHDDYKEYVAWKNQQKQQQQQQQQQQS